MYQRSSDGLWVGSVSCGFKADGKRNRRIVYGRTKAEALENLSKAKSETTITDVAGLSVRSYLSRWLSDAKAQHIEPSTQREYQQKIDTYINPAIGHILLAKLTPIQIQGLYSGLVRKHLAGGTRRIVHAVLRQALSQAVKWRLLQVNPADAVSAPRQDSAEMHPLENEAAVKAFIKATEGQRLRAMFIVAVYSGARRGELCALTWKDVDFHHGRIVISKTSKAEGRIGKTKTRSSRRTIDLPPEAMKAMQDHRKRMLTEGLAACPLVFPNENGKPLVGSTIHYVMQKVLTDSGLPPIRFHDLRHTHATLLLKAGVHPKVVQERLGHASIAITLDTYSHVLPSMQADVSEKLGRMLG